MALKNAFMLGLLFAATLTRVVSGEQSSPQSPEPHVTVFPEVQARSDWLLPDRISWAANMGLALVGYTGIILAVSALRKIERHAKDLEKAAVAATDTAQAVLQYAQAMIRSERPWIMITAEPCPGSEESSTVVATNRGKTPARIVATVTTITSAVDENHLPSAPEFPVHEPGISPVPIILLPGESTAINVFGREDVKQFCKTTEKLRRVENWNEKIFIYGRVTYDDLMAPTGQGGHETLWCCWYIYGQHKSGLVTIGIPALNVKT